MNGENEPTEVQDFGAVLGTPLNGERPLLVGGHAVNLWAWAYRDRIGDGLTRWLPLTSKDLDLYGTLSLLEELKRRFGGEYRLSGPRSPVVGQLVLNLRGKERKIDVLRNVVGLGPRDLDAQAAELKVQDESGSYVARVLPPIILLHAKIANLATLDQKDRNDYKHVRLMLLVIRAYLSQLLEAVRDSHIGSRDAIDQLELARTTVTSAHAIKCKTAHAIDFSEIWPRQLLSEASDERIRNFVKHRLPPSE